MQIDSSVPEGDGIPSNPDDPHREAKEHLAEFLLSLIQAFLRTGYYTPDHQEAKAAKEGLYQEFQRLLNKKGEMTFLVRDDPGGKSILIEGVLPEPHQLDSVMLKGMAEMYTPKFVKFLMKKDLISLTLKAAMSWKEFDSFIDLMGEPTFVETREKSDKDRFFQALKERGIFNISYIFNEELLAGERGIPWRSKIALSRLKKDFKMVPLYQNLDLEDLKRVKRQIIQDMTRPILNAEVLYPILINSDLAETEEFKGSEIDQEIISCIGDKMVVQVVQTLLSEVTGRENKESFTQKHGWLSKLLASSLNSREIKEREPILEDLYKLKLISAEDLPKSAQLRITRERNTEDFLNRSDLYLKEFDKVEDGKKYVKFAKSFLSLIPELIRRDRYNEIVEIVGRFDRHLNEKSPLSGYAEKTLEIISSNDKITGALKAKFLGGQKEICLAIAVIFLKLGRRAIPHLLSFLRESDDQLAINSAFETLMQIDPDAINALFGKQGKEEIPAETVIRFIRALGEIKGEAWLKPLTRTLRGYIQHENPRFREEALGAFYKIMGARGEKLYLALLNDAAISVQKSAIQCLGKIKSQAALGKFLEILKQVEAPGSDRVRQIESALLSALGYYGNIENLSEGMSLEDFLLEMMKKRLSLGPLRFIKKPKTTMTSGAIGAICETLGKVGTGKSRDILQKLEKLDEGLWKRKAEEALTRIAERESDPHAQNGGRP